MNLFKLQRKLNQRKNKRGGFSLVEAMIVISVGALITAAISGVVVGIFVAAKMMVGRKNANELTATYYRAEASGVASTLATAYSGAGIVATPAGGTETVTFRMQNTFTPASYSWNTTENRFTYTGVATAGGGTP